MQLTINKRFCGPPRSGNGGYVCGMIAKHLQGDCQVKLLQPPPLGCDLTLRYKDDIATLHNGDNLVAKAAAIDWQPLVPPQIPDTVAALDAQQRFSGFAHHDLPTCFVCGPKRHKGDGLCIFPGQLTDNANDGVAAIWELDASLADAQGNISTEFLWAALDCPGYFAVRDRAGFALLGAFSVNIGVEIPHNLGELIVVGWPISSEGRKHKAGTALIDHQGHILAQGLATWISVPKDAFVDATR